MGKTASRYFSIVTYATEKHIRKMFKSHINSIRAICWILHDKDESVPHYHLLLRTHSTWSSAQIKKWFVGFTDSKGETANTMVEVANNIDGLKDYILHADEKSIEAGKHRYAKSDIVDYGFNELSSCKNSYDNTYEILTRFMTGWSPRQLVKYYGRDFLYHINSYMQVRDAIVMHEGYKEAKTSMMFENIDIQDMTCDEISTWLNEK